MCMMYPIIKKCDSSNHRAAKIVREKQAIELLGGLYIRAHRNETTDLQYLSVESHAAHLVGTFVEDVQCCLYF